MLTNGPKMSDLNEGELLELKLSHNHETVGCKCCRGNLSSVCDPLTCFMPKGALKQVLVVI